MRAVLAAAVLLLTSCPGPFCDCAQPIHVAVTDAATGQGVTATITGLESAGCYRQEPGGPSYCTGSTPMGQPYSFTITAVGYASQTVTAQAPDENPYSNCNCWSARFDVALVAQ